ncbi:S-adenosyl-L-methionine-dependent methyltransferase [Wolfiporia cocos MD-104 SS10]|uniref:S-adenosyl-L-methionine-dependent methyltransferase n=1 Tax=Wolfiporia cocos (strain MD-104) TaxID=742152 RepID=A0A2H3IYX7_WOLCO|nr:S-adenosyl-L-methionine-dependent methyltransferase [Wolfiporia cocos MD-104 SS10]
MSAQDKVSQLRALINLLSVSSERVIREWETTGCNSNVPAQSDCDSSSHEVLDAIRTIIGACGACQALLQEPQARVYELAMQSYISRSLHIAAEARIADLLAEANPAEGITGESLGQKTGIECRKLVRVLRCLCSVGVFNEVHDNCFVNTETSRCLVGNDPLRSLIKLCGSTNFDSLQKLPSVLLDPEASPSYSPRDCAFQRAFGTTRTMWECFYDENVEEMGISSTCPLDTKNFGLAMVGLGRMYTAPLVHAYPWGALGNGIIVDVGGGVGGMCMDLLARFPQLRFILQDTRPVLDQAESIWLRDMPEAVHSGRVQMMPHNFFIEQPIKGAAVYFMRYVLHDWPDEECVKILTLLREAMGPRSRILAADRLIHTNVGSSYLQSAPPPLPPNYGCAHVLNNISDLSMLTLFNGMERTPEHISELAGQAGLKIVKMWESQGLMHIVEMRSASC